MSTSSSTTPARTTEMRRLICEAEDGPHALDAGVIICPIHQLDGVEVDDVADAHAGPQPAAPSSTGAHPASDTMPASDGGDAVAAAEAGAVADVDTATAPPAADTCYGCGASLPDDDNSTCPTCRRPRIRPGLQLLFDHGGTVTVEVGRNTLLGRHPGRSPHAAVFRDRDGVSKKHATVGVRSNGEAWIRDEDSLNGTFVNGRRIAKARAETLRHSDRIGLGRTTATVRLPGREG